jgi:hypothetical protein
MDQIIEIECPTKDKCCKTLIKKIDIKPAKGLREVKETKQA